MALIWKAPPKYTRETTCLFQSQTASQTSPTITTCMQCHCNEQLWLQLPVVLFSVDLCQYLQHFSANCNIDSNTKTIQIFVNIWISNYSDIVLVDPIASPDTRPLAHLANEFSTSCNIESSDHYQIWQQTRLMSNSWIHKAPSIQSLLQRWPYRLLLYRLLRMNNEIFK